MIRIAFVGHAGSGKTTLANALARNYSVALESLATPLKAFAALAYGPIDKDAEYIVAPAWTTTPLRLTGRQLLQRVGTEVVRDTLDVDFWVRALGRRLDPGGSYVVDDARFPNEVMWLRRAGFMIVRVAGRGTVDGEHPSEQLSRLVCDLTVQNVDTPNAISHDIIVRYNDFQMSLPTVLRGGVHG